MRILVRVVPRSHNNTLVWEGGTLKAHLTAPPIEGKANAALTSLLSECLSVSRRSITLIQGAKSRQKVVDIEGLTPEMLEQKIRKAEKAGQE